HWRWSERIEVVHLYLSPGAVADVAADVYEREIDAVELRDVLRADDPVLQGIAAQLEAETRNGGLGERVYTDSLRLQASIHLLRRYADISIRGTAAPGQLSHTQKRRLIDYVMNSLDQQISLGSMAAQLDLG